MRKIPMEAGWRFGRLVTLAFYRDNQRPRPHWICVCDCGAFLTVSARNLRKGNNTSCGCKRMEKIKTHGLTKTPEYGAWRSMRDRCYNKKCDSYPAYGGRGITVCDEWCGKNGFIKFLEHIGPRPSPEYSVDRYPDNNSGYRPGNVRWTTHKEQGHNMRSTKLNEELVSKIRATESSVSQTEWARRIGVSQPLISLVRSEKIW